LPSEDPEISEVSSKCLSILVQLYGGENLDSLSPENLETFADLLVAKEDPKDQKLLLRILRRMKQYQRKFFSAVQFIQAGLSPLVSHNILTQQKTPDHQVTSNEKHLESLKNTGSLLQALERLAPAHRIPVVASSPDSGFCLHLSGSSPNFSCHQAHQSQDIELTFSYALVQKRAALVAMAVEQ
ncbi:hypothetical protein A6R68_02238, partial [Neotoma lepida]